MRSAAASARSSRVSASAESAASIRGFFVEDLYREDAVLVVDETGDLKKGMHTVGVRRQHTGTAGRIESSELLQRCRSRVRTALASDVMRFGLPAPGSRSAGRE
ncbi:hypothetical protein D7294_08120 [Streptomyces hoynatensis]|uniref:Transposase IS701-like DDE domain-containing protein n=1 Tax=Streptomyces hoynatensis TaxID=1141874 RepID=A0A3A9ZCK3_9ACTN|nr:hypothetical protein D7294_08120 [Streptomyces hoynatensis]